MRYFNRRSSGEVKMSEDDKKIAKSNGEYVVLCPHCKGENEVMASDVGETWICSFTVCDKEFIVGIYEV